jgi:tetratricopeptide (TPR) repeat protein
MTTTLSGEARSYWAFVSYSSHDRVWARWLQRAIETYAVPRRLVGRPTLAGPAPRRLRPIFRDRTELAADADLAARVQGALEQSAYLIVICSPDAAASRWVDKEIRGFRAAHGEGRILAVIVAGRPGGDHQDCFPPALRYRDEAGERTHVEPIAADLRPGGDGRRLTLLKLVAGMLGVGLDELVRRDAQRRTRQFAALAAASFAGMAIMAGLAGAALVARNEARRQRGQAESLIEFMLTDLRRRLEPSGQLDLMDGIGPKALAYYAAQNPGDLDARALSQRAGALRLMGEISEQRGHLAEALRAYEAASATTAEQLARAPDDGQRIFDHAQNVYWVGEIAYKRGEDAKAEGAFKTYLALANQLTALAPGRDDWRMEASYAGTSLGALYLEQGRTDEAVRAFTVALNVSLGLAARHPTDNDQAQQAGQAHAWLADAFEKQGRLGDARAHRLAQLALAQDSLARDGSFQKAKVDTIVAMRALARQDMLRGDVAAALKGYSDAVARAEALLATQPDNMDLTVYSAAIAELDLCETLLAARRYGEAGEHQRRAESLIATALAHDSTVQEWRGYRDRGRLLEAALAARRGEWAEALKLDSATLAELATEPQVGVNTDSRCLLDRARLQTGDDLAALGRASDARAQWTAAAADLNGPLDRYEPRLLVVLADADKRLGRTADARAAHRRLAALLPAARHT